jgi:hypothetical protein
MRSRPPCGPGARSVRIPRRLRTNRGRRQEARQAAVSGRGMRRRLGSTRRWRSRPLRGRTPVPRWERLGASRTARASDNPLSRGIGIGHGPSGGLRATVRCRRERIGSACRIEARSCRGGSGSVTVRGFGFMGRVRYNGTDVLVRTGGLVDRGRPRCRCPSTLRPGDATGIGVGSRVALRGRSGRYRGAIGIRVRGKGGRRPNSGFQGGSAAARFSWRYSGPWLNAAMNR